MCEGAPHLPAQARRSRTNEARVRDRACCSRGKVSPGSLPVGPSVVPGLLLLLVVSPLAAQSLGRGRPVPVFQEAPGWAEGAGLMVANATLGAVSATVVRACRGEPLVPGLLWGAAGGAIHYAGKRVAVERFDGAGLLGRQIGGVGTSVVRNAMDGGRGPLDELMLPLGPVRMYVRTRGAGPRVRARLDVTAVAAALYARWNPALHLDAGESLSSGTLVFRVNNRAIHMPWSDTELCGAELSSTILLSRLFEAETDARVFAHERVHVIQSDYVQHVVSDPLVGLLMGGTATGRALHRHVELNVGEVLTGLLEHALLRSYSHRPWEIEADGLAFR